MIKNSTPSSLLACGLVVTALLTSSVVYAEVSRTISRTTSKTSESAYAVASQGYKAYESKNYALAAQKAQRATELAPGRRAYWLLWMNALVADGKLEAAQHLVNNIERRFGRKSDVLAAQKTIKAQLAFNASAASYRALERHDLVQATELARRAVDYLPAVTAFRVALINALVADKKLTQAEKAASDIITSKTSSSEVVLLRGAVRQLNGSRELAQADFDRAIVTANPAAQKQIRLVAVDAALANNDPKRALLVLAPLEADADKEVTRRYALATSTLDQAKPTWFAPQFGFPYVSCTTQPDLTSVCDVNVGNTYPDPGFVLADQGYRAFSDKNYILASNKAAEAIRLSPQNRNYRSLYVHALVFQGALAEAEQAASDSLTDLGNDAETLLTRADIRKQRGNMDGAKADYAAVLTASNMTPRSEIAALVALGRDGEARERYSTVASTPQNKSELDLAYLALQVGDDATALDLFSRAAEKGELTDTAHFDAAYAAAREGRNGQAINYFNQTIDAAEADRIKLDPQQIYDIRRTSADLERRWGINALVNKGRLASEGFGLPLGSNSDSVYVGAEAYWRPFGYQNRKLLEVYSRVSETVSGGDGIKTGSSTAQLAFGARVKPFSDINAILGLERLVALGDATNSDWLARAGFSSDSGLDLHVDKTHWLSGHLYAEAGHYFQHAQNYAILEGQLGRSYRLGGADSTFVIFPHVVVGGEYDSTVVDRDKQAWGSGLGTSLRYWFRQDHYIAPRSYADLSLQYRWRVAGDARGEGWFVRFSVLY